ncbi:GNAT family N-acetyltransferase [Rhodopila sp.]|uniref:GNAT family N-acetyltransferase n=1 Tax=Rhodopila sp. TaxID=2480087 RepID=UPI002C0B01FE|nr:GNAT family N-acetyltransferase [Rhodopila sp.]HVZ07055.1 GNAT family N-acetyltransferase [Rhodopila sp.]
MAERAYRLAPPRSRSEWDAYHAIRRRVFSLPRPEEPTDPASHAMLLFLNEAPIGAIQIDDLHNCSAALRLVAIDPSRQGEGHGRVMLREAEAFARRIGCRQAVVYATPEAAGFYAGCGYDEEDWDEVCMGGIVQMLKHLD